MKSFYRKLMIFGTCAILTVSLVGCNFFNNQEVINNNQENSGVTEDYNSNDNENITENNTPLNSYTIAELKKEFEVLGATSNYSFKPFYNVEQTTEFTFHFNSMVDPIKAITVHTDSKCEESSTVYQLNDGYKVENGVDIVVKPNNSVLAVDARKDAEEKGIWGYAPIYYLCIRYDLDSTTVKKLDEPIIIPFTIKNEISTPNAYANISDDGTFSVKWFSVEDAVSYNVYRSFFGTVKKEAKELTREECAYAGETFKLVKSVNASTLEYIEEPAALITGKIEENAHITENGYVRTQNVEHGYTYYITAVDAKGNESFFSRAISDYKYSNVLPKKVENESLGVIDGKYYIDEFKDTVGVLQCDEKTLVNYPINYYKLDTNYTNDKCTYRYEIVGTKLTGEITYYNENGEFPESFISSVKTNTGSLVDIQKETIPSVDVDTMNDSDYKNAKIDLASATTYPEEAKIKLDAASLYRRADLEAARIITGGVYPKSLDSIETYVENDNPEYIAVKLPNGVIEVRKNDGQSSTVPEEIEKPNEVEQQEEIEKPNEVEQPEEIEKPNEVEQPEEIEKPNEVEQPEEIEKSESDEPDTEINNNNYVDEQRKSTEKQVEEADKETIEKTEYPIFAQTAGQKYLALCLINQEEEISLKAFPEYQDFNEFIDDLCYVWYQNPYIMGIDINNSGISDDRQTFYPNYSVNKNTAKRYQAEIAKKAKTVIDKIITPGMSEQEKAIEIYTYLEESAEYNHEAANYSSSGATDVYKKYSNSWNTYGILCEEKGVCQSYAYAFNLLAYECDLESVMVTGTMNNGGHAWNAVKIDDTWYMLDSTNNAKSVGAPYWICNSSTEFIFENGFAFWDTFVDGTNTSEFKINDEKVDWYYSQGLLAETPEDCADIWYKMKDSNDKVYIKYAITNADDFATRFIKQAMNNGASQSDLMNVKFNSAVGLTVLFNE